MRTYKQLLEQWHEASNGGQVLVAKDHPLKLYVDNTAEGRKELLVEVSGEKELMQRTVSLQVNNYTINGGATYLGIELLDKTLESEFAYMCLDIINSSYTCKTKTAAYKKVVSTYQKWNNLLANARREILSEQAIRGLMGELKYIFDEIEEGHLSLDVIQAWKTFKDASRDFIFDSTWAEVKTAETTKDYVTISSLEQLEFDGGNLVVYKLNKVNDDSEGTSLNEMVDSVKALLDPVSGTEFVKKLIEKSYQYNNEYDHYRYVFEDKLKYLIDESFPRIRSSMVDDAIVRAKYDIKLERIERWRTT